MTEADKAAAYQKLVAYPSHNRLERPARFVTSVDIAWFASWIGTDQARDYKLDGDRLEIVTRPTPLPGDATATKVLGVLSWRRDNI